MNKTTTLRVSGDRIKQLHIHTTQGYSGRLTRESQIIFNYATEDPEREISLTMPLTTRSYAENILPGVLRQNLPEGFLRDWIREQFGKAMKMDDFNILALTGKDMIGRVRCSRSEFTTGDIPEPVDLKELLAWKGSEDLFEHLAQKYAATSGISGVQPKVLVSTHPDREVVVKSSIKDRSLIVKAGGADYTGLAENEYHCMSIGKLAGLITPQFWLSDNRELFVVERFDMDDQGRYLGFEDMTALTGRQNEAKYEGSYEIVAKAVGKFATPALKADSLHELFRSVVLSVVVRNGDAHLKNFGMLYTTPHTEDVRLSPLYDVVNTTVYLPKDVLALKLKKTKSWPGREDLVEFGQTACLIDRPDQVIDQVVEAAHAYQPAIEAGPIWNEMRAQIDKGLGSVRGSRFHAVAMPADHLDGEDEGRPAPGLS